MGFGNIGQRFQLRSAQSFFDVGSFKPPRDLGDLSSRLSTNVDYFQANYSILVAIVLAYVCYHDQYLLFAVLCLAGAGYWLFAIRKNPLGLSGRVFSEQEILIGFAVAAGTVVSYVGGKFLTYSLAFAGLLILIHAGMHLATASARATKAVNDALN